MSDSDEAGLDLDSVFTVSDNSLYLRVVHVYEESVKVRSHQDHHHPSPHLPYIREKV